jgi:signal transduction histidine kinase
MDNEIATAIVITTLLVLVLLGGIILTFFIIARQRTEKRLALINARLEYEKELRTIETEVEKDLMNHLARELHDNVGHLITLARLEYENKTFGQPQLKDNLHTLNDYIHQISTEVRSLSRSLSDDYLKSVRLDKAIEMALERIRRSANLHIETNVSYEKDLTADQELIVFRICQEALTNIVRHAQAKKLAIELVSKPAFCCSITDDGIGFDWKQLRENGKVNGLLNMKKRAALAGMELTVDSKIHHGTTLTLRIDEHLQHSPD